MSAYAWWRNKPYRVVMIDPVTGDKLRQAAPWNTTREQMRRVKQRMLKAGELVTFDYKDMVSVKSLRPVPLNRSFVSSQGKLV